MAGVAPPLNVTVVVRGNAGASSSGAKRTASSVPFEVLPNTSGVDSALITRLVEPTVGEGQASAG